MKGKRFIVPIIALSFLVSYPGLCFSKDKESALTVKRIVFTGDKTGEERVTLFCNQPCTPQVSSLDGKNPRVVMDLEGVSRIETTARHVNTQGKLVKRIRSYLDGKTNVLRVVLDLEPSKSHVVRQKQDPSGNFMLTIKEDKASPRSKDRRITMIRPDLRTVEQKSDVKDVAPSTGKRSALNVVKDIPPIEQGKSQLNDGEFAAAVDTFTQILATDQNNSLIYRLRGDAYDNLGDEQSALKDWTQAARLGDTVIQSSLDSQGVIWRENPSQ